MGPNGKGVSYVGSRDCCGAGTTGVGIARYRAVAEQAVQNLRDRQDAWLARGGLFSPIAVRASTAIFWLWLVSGLGYVLWQVTR